ncbi:MAG: hypothetical protein FJ050_03760 [Cyanobacteria bacterium M_surface_7_m2_040]|nr:hypothetical protein [Cyanobacteria bacterium M_surface_7_m2_040]
MSEASLWQRLLPLALGAAVSPLLLLGQLAQLIGSGPLPLQLRRSGAYLVGATLVVLIWSWIGGWIANRLPQHQGAPDPVAAVVQLMLGLALACLSLRILIRNGNDSVAAEATETTAATPASMGLERALLSGISLMAVNLTSLVLFLPASQDIGRSGLPWPLRLAAWLVLDLLTLLPVWFPPLLVLLSGTAGHRLLGSLGHWVQAHRSSIDVAVAAGFAVVLLGRGLAEL